MPSAVSVRTDFSASELRRLAAATKHANQSRRRLSIAAVLDGMDRQTLRDRVHRCNEHGPDGLRDAGVATLLCCLIAPAGTARATLSCRGT
jgi:hypothetical protein